MTVLAAYIGVNGGEFGYCLCTSRLKCVQKLSESCYNYLSALCYSWYE